MKKPSSSNGLAKTGGVDCKRSGQVSGRGQVSGGNGDDLWPLLTEFALNMRGWWISTCYSLDLTPAQGMALRSLNPDVPLAMSALAETLTCDASNITGVVDKMEARGLIARQGAENDRRVKVLVVTEKGRQLRSELLSRAAKAPPEIAAMPKQTRSLLAAGLRAFLARSN
jgi:DNA-binding MarR family transcriptional regulator